MQGRIVVLMAGLCASLALPASARACSYRTCVLDYLAPGPAARVPANIPALVLGVYDDGELFLPLLVHADGEIVDLIQDPRAEPLFLLARPVAPLRPGRYSLELQHRFCGPNSYGTRVAQFDAGPAMPLPTETGHVVIGPQVRVIRTPMDCPAQPTLVEAVSLTFTPSAGLAPFMPITRLKLAVDGESWAESRFGPVGSVPFMDQRTVAEIFAVCSPHGTLGALGTSSGVHRGLLTAEIAGSTTPLPPVEFTFEITCDRDAVAAASDHARAIAPAPHGGCAIGGDRSAGPMIVALAALIWRRRRLRR